MLRIPVKLIGLGLVFTSMAFTLFFTRRGMRRQLAVQSHLKLVCRILNLRIHSELPFPREMPRLILANHVSYLDILMIGSLFPTSFLAKAEVASWPVLGKLGKLGQAEFVKRECAYSRVRALYKIKNQMKEIPFCIFPEGTTSTNSIPSEKSWYRGHAYLSRFSPKGIYCLGLTYEDQDQIAWIDDQALIPHLLRLLRRERIDVFVNGAVIRQDARTSLKDIPKTTYNTIIKLTKATHLNTERALTKTGSKRRALAGAGVWGHTRVSPAECEAEPHGQQRSVPALQTESRNNSL